MLFNRYLLLLIFCGNILIASSQVTPVNPVSVSDKSINAIQRKTEKLTIAIAKANKFYLAKLSRREQKLKAAAYKKDSARCIIIFDQLNTQYALPDSSNNNSSTAIDYSPQLDSLLTAVKFLNQSGSNSQLTRLQNQLESLQYKLNFNSALNNQVRKRQEFLQKQLEQIGLVKKFKKYLEELYYYDAKLKQLKSDFGDLHKWESLFISLALKSNLFQNFFAKNSILGSLLALPSNNATSTASIQGLQTRAMLNQSLIDRFGSGPNVNRMFQQNIQSAQGQLDLLKNKMNGLANGSIGNTTNQDIPGFKPNSQKTKSFFQRLELGSNIESQKAHYMFPVTSDIGLSLGYKLNDKSSIGVGASYKLGWGSNWNNIRISHQGVGLRSYLDWKIKGSFYLSGGYEQNYRSAINSIAQLKEYDAWQTSGLIGLSKKYSISQKLKGEMKLLWDFMSYQQIPRTQPILFRIGYNIK